MQSAALYIVKQAGGYGGFNDRYVDLRVDDHEEPIQELKRLLTLQRLYSGRTKTEDRMPLEGEVLREVVGHLVRAGYWDQSPETAGTYDESLQSALRAYFMTENFDDRWTEEAIIDREVLLFMRRQA